MRRFSFLQLLIGLLIVGVCADAGAQQTNAPIRGGSSASAIESVIRRIPARDACPVPLSAPSRRRNWKQAAEAFVKVDAGKLDDAEKAQLAMSRAEVIDLAMALREDFSPPAAPQLTSAYAEYRTTIDRIAIEDWHTSNFTSIEGKSLAEAGMRLVNASQIDLAAIFLRDCSSACPRVTAALVAHTQALKRLASRDWKSSDIPETETASLVAVIDAHMRDVAGGLNQVFVAQPQHAARSDYAKYRQALQRVAMGKWSDKMAAEESTAVCAVLKAYVTVR